MSMSNTPHEEFYLGYINNSPIPGMENSSTASTIPMITMDTNEGTDISFNSSSVSNITMDLHMCTIDDDDTTLALDRSVDQCQFREKCEDLSKLEMPQQWECSVKIPTESPSPEEKGKLGNIMPNSYSSSSPSSCRRWINSSLTSALQNSSPQQKLLLLESQGLRVNFNKPNLSQYQNQNQGGLHKLKHSPRHLNSQPRFNRFRLRVCSSYGPAIYWNGFGSNRHRQSHENKNTSVGIGVGVGFGTVGQLSESHEEMDYRTKFEYESDQITQTIERLHV